MAQVMLYTLPEDVAAGGIAVHTVIVAETRLSLARIFRAKAFLWADEILI